jgi:hypothetical protein
MSTIISNAAAIPASKPVATMASQRKGVGVDGVSGTVNVAPPVLDPSVYVMLITSGTA